MYEQSFVSSLIEKYKLKKAKFPNEVDYDAFFESKTLYELDNKITAPYFNFSDASSFYEEISSTKTFDKDRSPTFMLNSLDDPLSPPDCFPSDKELSSPFPKFFYNRKRQDMWLLFQEIHPIG